MDRDGSQVGVAGYHIYVDGVLKATLPQASFTVASDPSNTAAIQIGEHSTSYEYTGAVDQARVYNYALNPAQIAWNFNLGEPIGWWKMDDCTGTSITDTSVTGSGAAGGKNGTWSGASGTNTSAGTCSAVDTATAWYNGRTGKFNGSLDFDGGGANADDKVAVTNVSAIDLNLGLSNGFSFSAWIYPESDGEGDAGRIFDKGNTYCKIGSESGGQATVSCRVDLTTDAEYSATTKVTIGQWNHVAFSWTNDSDDEVTIWVNGVPNTSSATFAGNPTAESTDITIGNIAAQSATFDGKIDDFRIYSYEQTAAQIKTNILQGAVRFGPQTGSPEF